MPWKRPAEQMLPYQSDGPGLDSTSASGALAIAADAAAIQEQYFRWLDRRMTFGATDLEAETALKIDRCTIIPRRHECKGQVVDSGRVRSRVIRSRTDPSKHRIAYSTVWVTARWAPPANTIEQGGGKVSRQAHTLQQAGSIPAPATNSTCAADWAGVAGPCCSGEERGASPAAQETGR